MAKRKINYPPTRKAAGDKECPICGKVCKARGIKGHLLFKHKLKWEQLIQVSSDTPKVTRVTKNETPSKNKSNSSKSRNPKRQVLSEKDNLTQVSQNSETPAMSTVTQVSPIKNTCRDLPPRSSVQQMQAMERPFLTEGLIEVRPEFQTPATKHIRYCTMVGRDQKIKRNVYRIDAFKSGKVSVWWYNEIISIDAKELATHFDSVIKNAEQSRLFHEATKTKEIR